jgi:hypothetical protein
LPRHHNEPDHPSWDLALIYCSVQLDDPLWLIAYDFSSDAILRAHYDATKTWQDSRQAKKLGYVLEALAVVEIERMRGPKVECNE